MYYRSEIWHIDLKNFLRFKNWLSPLSPSLSTLTATLNPIPQERSQIFSDPIFFGLGIFLKPKFFWTHNFFGPFFFRTQNFLDPNFFGLKFFGPKMFSEPKFFRPKIFLYPKFLRPYILLDTKFFSDPKFSQLGPENLEAKKFVEKKICHKNVLVQRF